MVEQNINVETTNVELTPTNNETTVVETKRVSKFDSFFKISARNSTIKKELIGGLSTFLAMVYILFVNPSLLTATPAAAPTEWYGSIFLGTTVITFAGTLLLGLLGNVPIVQAPGMGINSFLTFTVCSQFGLKYGEALICVMISGILYTIVAATPLRKMITESVPKNFKIGIAVMIGLFISYVGLTGSGIVTAGSGTPTELFKNFKDSRITGLLVIGLIGIILGVTLQFCNVKFSILITIGAVIIMLLIAGAIDSKNIGDKIFVLGDYSEFANFKVASGNMFDSFKTVFTKPTAYVAIFCFLYVNLFDTTSVLTWARNDEGFIITNKEDENKKMGWVSKAYIANAVCSTVGSFMLTSNLTTYVESASGVKTGARTGLSSVFVALLIALCIPLYPLLAPLKPIAFEPLTANTSPISIQVIAGPVSVIIGALIMSELRHFDWKKFTDVPVLLFIIVFGFLGYSLSIGMAMGSVIYVLIYGINGIVYAIKNRKNPEYNTLTLKERYKQACEISATMWVITALSVAYIIIEILIKANVM